jgi:hypothetical protein
MITELGKRCQEMVRIEDFASFKSELLGALGGPRPLTYFFSPGSARRLSFFPPHLKKGLVTAMQLL